jgi:hypothetical protein
MTRALGMSRTKKRKRKNTAHRQMLQLQSEARRAIKALATTPAPKEPRNA